MPVIMQNLVSNELRGRRLDYMIYIIMTNRDFKVRQAWYRKIYLKSEHWKNLKKEKKKVNPVCERCGAKRKLDVHHKHYRSLYDVILEDLETLCRRCHKKEHNRLNRFKKKSLRSKLRGLRRLLRS